MNEKQKEQIAEDVLTKLTDVFVSVKEQIPPRVYLRAVAMHCAYIVAQSPDAEGYWNEFKAQINAAWDGPVVKALRQRATRGAGSKR